MYEKIGLHIIGNEPVDVRGVPCLTLVNPSVEYVHRCLDQTDWRAKIVIRWTDSYGDIVWHPDMDFMPRHENILYQGHNERVVKSHNIASAWLNEETMRLRRLHQTGRNGALLCPSVGQYEPAIWEQLRPIAQEMRQNDAIVVHEYWPEARDLHDPGQWLCGRWAKTQWLHNVPIIVTEIGRDEADGGGWSGWKLAGISSEEYLEEIREYNSRWLMPYPNVIGGTIFTVGRDAKWGHFDVSEVVWPEIQRQRRVTVTPPPEWTPPEVPVVPAPPAVAPGLSCEEIRDDIQGWHERLIAIEDTLDEMNAQVRVLRADMLAIAREMCR